jgi:hypothetical protein
MACAIRVELEVPSGRKNMFLLGFAYIGFVLQTLVFVEVIEIVETSAKY